MTTIIACLHSFVAPKHQINDGLKNEEEEEEN